MSSRGKRYDNVVSITDSSSDEEYDRDDIKYNKNSDESYDNDDCDSVKISRKTDTSSSSYYDVANKRGRGQSRRPCMNKNAQAARENRIRKKKHLEKVENKLSYYQQKNKSLVNVIQKQDIDIKKLKGEVTYLRCILKNNTNITALLQSMNDGLSKKPKSNADMALKKTHSDFDHTYTIPETETETEKRNDAVILKDKSIFDEEISLDFDKEESPSSVFNESRQFFNDNISDTETMDEWSRLNVNIYDNIHVLSPTNDDNVENFHNIYNDSNLLEQFRDAGICLHVNSDKVSLEFCSICHMNSINSSME